MSSDIEQIKSKLSIAEIVGQYIELQASGRNYKARCPFHNEKTPSFMVSPERQTFYCFGCGKKGDIFSFVQEFEGVDFPDALKSLADRAGVTLSNVPQKNSKDKKREEFGYEMLELAKDFYQNTLMQNEAAKEYLKSRGITKEVVETWGIGCAKDEWRSLKEFILGKNKESEKLLLDTGLVKQGEKGESYDTFRNRIQFPLFSESGKVVGFTGRSLDDSEQAKYLNSPDTFLFNKSQILYGFHLAKGAIRKNGFSILVEGQFDVIASHVMGYKNTVATSGTAISETQLSLLKRLSNNLVIALDGDSAGFKASARVWSLALGLGMDVKVAALPADSDPADMLVSDQEKWKKIVKSAKHVIEYITDYYFEKIADKRQLGKTIHSEVVPLIQMLESEVEKSYFAEYISKVAQLDIVALKREIDAIPPKSSKSAHGTEDESYSYDGAHEEQVAEKPAQNSSHQFLQHLTALLLWQERATEPFISSVDEYKERFKTLVGDQLAERYLSQDVDLLHDTFFKFDDVYTDKIIFIKTLEEQLDRLSLKILEKRRSVVQQKIVQLEAMKDEEKLETAMQELQEINKKIHTTKTQDI